MTTARGYHVYILYDWEGIPRYVGAGKRYRWNRSGNHDENAGNDMKKAFIKETKAKLGQVPYRVIKEDLSREEAFLLERELIAKIGRNPNGPLTNISDGGAGSTGTKSPEWRAKISATLTGHVESEETRAKKAAAGRGRVQSEATKAKRSATLTGRKFSPEHLANLRAAVAKRTSRKGIPLSEEARANQSKGQRKAWADNPIPRVSKDTNGRFTSET